MDQTFLQVMSPSNSRSVGEENLPEREEQAANMSAEGSEERVPIMDQAHVEEEAKEDTMQELVEQMKKVQQVSSQKAAEVDQLMLMMSKKDEEMQQLKLMVSELLQMKRGEHGAQAGQQVVGPPSHVPTFGEQQPTPASNSAFGAGYGNQHGEQLFSGMSMDSLFSALHEQQ